MKPFSMICLLVVMALLLNYETQSCNVHSERPMNVERETAIYMAAFRYVYKKQRQRWPKVKNWVLVGIENRDAVAKQLRKTGYHVVVHEADSSYYDEEHLVFDASDFKYQKQNRVLALVRIHRLGTYDHVHRTRGGNYWTWATLQLKIGHGRWMVIGLKDKWEGQDWKTVQQVAQQETHCTSTPLRYASWRG